MFNEVEVAVPLQSNGTPPALLRSALSCEVHRVHASAAIVVAPLGGISVDLEVNGRRTVRVEGQGEDVAFASASQREGLV